MSPRMERLFARIAHGDEEHRAWLSAQLSLFEQEDPEPDLVADVEAFHVKFHPEMEVPKARVLPMELAEFRREFLREEVKEYCDESYLAQQALATPEVDPTPHLANMLDALVDEVYVAIGTAYYHGFDFREAWRRVQAANMAKERCARVEDSKRGTLYDVVKPPGWAAPDHTDLVIDHAHK